MSKSFVKLKLELDLDDTLMFGSMYGLTLKEAIILDSAYIKWALRQPYLLYVSEEAEDFIECYMPQPLVVEAYDSFEFEDVPW